MDAAADAQAAWAATALGRSAGIVEVHGDNFAWALAGHGIDLGDATVVHHTSSGARNDM